MKKSKLFLDMEFTGLHQNTTIISLGITGPRTQTFYAEFTDYDKTQVDDWIWNNVISNLRLTERYPDGKDIKPNFEIMAGRDTVKKYLTQWLGYFEEVEIWSDCYAYDWVLFNDLWGHAFNVPDHIHYIPFDLSTQFKLSGIDPDISREEFAGLDQTQVQKHNSLWDAQVIKACHKKLRNNELQKLKKQVLDLDKTDFLTINKIAEVLGERLNIVYQILKNK